MKKLSIFLSVAIITALCFWALVGISEENRYTSVRKYTKPKTQTDTVVPMEKTIAPPVIETTVPKAVDTVKPVADTTPPVIEFLSHTDEEVVYTRTIDIRVKATDNLTPSGKLVVEWDGIQNLEDGFNPIVVSATDEAGNVGTAYIIIEKK